MFFFQSKVWIAVVINFIVYRFIVNSRVWIAVVTSKAPRGGGKLNGFHNLTASLRSAEGASLRSAGARFARLGLGSLAWGAHMLQYATESYRYYSGI